MEMIDNIDFAIRSIDIYLRTKNQTEHEFTHICGTLLNILSVIRGDDGYLIDLPVSTVLPGNNDSKQDIISLMNNLRNGLAHKTNENFKGNAADRTERLYSVTIDSRRGTPLELQFADLVDIFDYLVSCIKSKYPKRFVL